MDERTRLETKAVGCKGERESLTSIPYVAVPSISVLTVSKSRCKWYCSILIKILEPARDNSDDVRLAGETSDWVEQRVLGRASQKYKTEAPPLQTKQIYRTSFEP